MDAAALVLAGGRSSRMGRPKAALDWHGLPLLERTVRLLARTVRGPVVVVAAPGQDLPALPDGAVRVDDPVEGRGPLQGLAAGLAAVAGAAGNRTPVFACSTDLPHLHPAYVRAVLSALGTDDDAVLPVVHGHRQPLAAAYRAGLAGAAADLVAAGRPRPGLLLDAVRTVLLDEAALLADPRLAAVDPGLLSVAGVNTPEELAAGRARPLPAVTLDGVAHRAATVAGLLLGVGGRATAGRAVLVDGRPAGARAPLVEGDRVELA